MRARFIAPWKDSTEKPVICHCVSRVVERRFAFGKEDKERLRTYLRMNWRCFEAMPDDFCG